MSDGFKWHLMKLFSQCPCTKPFGVYIDMTLPEWQHTRRKQNACLVHQRKSVCQFTAFSWWPRFLQILLCLTEKCHSGLCLFTVFGMDPQDTQRHGALLPLWASRWKVPFLSINSWLAKGDPDPTPAPAYGHWEGKDLSWLLLVLQSRWERSSTKSTVRWCLWLSML